MSRHRARARDYIESMLKCSGKIAQFSADRTRESFLSDALVQDATVRNLEILGEASRQLLDVLPDAASRFPQLDFRTMYALRNRLIHGYLTVNMEIVWDVIQNEIPVLRPVLEQILANWPSDLT